MSAPDPKDPRFRSYRAAAYGLYIAVVAAFSLAIIFSVSRSVAALTPPRPSPGEAVLSFRECLDGADALWAQLEAEREQLVRASVASGVDKQWMDFRARWLQTLRERESHCALDSRNNADLKRVFVLLAQVQDRYAIHAAQYASEVGGKVDALREALAAARRNPAAGQGR